LSYYSKTKITYLNYFKVSKFNNILISCYTLGSDNDNPNILPKDQIFMILEMENGGIDVENFIFNSADQSLFAFLQVCYNKNVIFH